MSNGLAHELWAAAQCAPGEGIEDAVVRIEEILNRVQARPNSVNLTDEEILALVAKEFDGDHMDSDIPLVRAAITLLRAKESK